MRPAETVGFVTTENKNKIAFLLTSKVIQMV
jgi:hypothetical protein